MKLFFLALLFGFFVQFAPAQTDAPLWQELQIGGDTLSLHLDDYAEINLTSTVRFIKAVELEIQLPRSFIDTHVSLALSVYQKDPSSQDVPPSNSRIAWEVLPPERHFYVDIPLIRQADLKASVDTAVVKNPVQFPLAIAIRPLETSPALHLQLEFQVRARWLDTDLGGLDLQTPNLNVEQRKELRILVNGRREDSPGILFFPPGVYDVVLSLQGYKPRTLTAVITSSKVTQLTAYLQEDPPRVAFEAPKGTQVYLDGKFVPPEVWKSLTISKGIHTVQFIIGGYQVTDNFEISRGGLHKISLLLQIGFQEN